MKNAEHDRTSETLASARPVMRARSIALLSVLALLTALGGLALQAFEAPAGAAVNPGRVNFSAGSASPGAAAPVVHFHGTLDRSSVLQGSDGIVKVELEMRAEELPSGKAIRVPTDLVVVLDRSGSMRGEPLAHALGAVRELISQLRPEDRFALVGYASGARTHIPLSAADSKARAGWLATANGIRAGGGTHMASGLDLAHDVLRGAARAGRSQRVILLSDGHANEGDHSFAGLRNRAARAVTGEYVLSAVGVGLGFDEHVMAGLADAGTGNFHYVQRAGELGEVFAGEFESARGTVASALEVRIETLPGVEVTDAAGYPLTRDGSVTVFRPGSLFAGQSRRVWLTLRAPTADVGDVALARFALGYDLLDGERERLEFRHTPSVACVEGEQDFYAALDADAWSRSLVEDGYNELKQAVSRDLQLGRAEQARSRISVFKQKAREMNAQVQSQKVEHQLGLLEDFEEEVDSAFAAPEPARSAYSKKISAEAIDGRRQGAKKAR